jgi:hypothetical protein
VSDIPVLCDFCHTRCVVRVGAGAMVVCLLAAAACLDSPPGQVSQDGGGGGNDTGEDGGDAGRQAGDAGACAADATFPDFRDDFSTGGLAWGEEQHSGGAPDAVLRLVGGTLSFEPTMQSPETVWMRTVDHYDMTDLRVAVRVVEVLADQTPSPTAFFRLTDGGGGQESMFLTDGDLRAVGSSVAFDAEAHAWWQIRSEGETIFFETSKDAVNWNLLAVITPRTFDLTDVVVEIGIAIDGDLPDSAGRFRIDDLNETPDRCPVKEIGR